MNSTTAIPCGLEGVVSRRRAVVGPVNDPKVRMMSEDEVHYSQIKSREILGPNWQAIIFPPKARARTVELLPNPIMAHY